MFAQEVEEPTASLEDPADSPESSALPLAPEAPIELDIAPFPFQRGEPVGSESEQPPAGQKINLSKVLDLSLATPITKYTPTGFAFDFKDVAARCGIQLKRGVLILPPLSCALSDRLILGKKVD